MKHLKWPKTARLENIGVIITEKLDGSNGLIAIDAEGNMKVGSRNRWLTLDDDNYAFAAWCEGRKEELKKLGEGYHYGEWVGRGINRSYNLPDRRFYLFEHRREIPNCCHRVPFIDSTGLGGLSAAIHEVKEEMDGVSHIDDRTMSEGLIVHIPKLDRRFKVIWNK